MSLDMLLVAFDRMITAPLGLIYMLILTDEWRYSKKAVATLCVGYTVLIMGVNLAMTAKWGLSSNIPLFNTLTCFLFYFFIYRYRDGRLLFIYFSASAFIFISDTLSDVIFGNFSISHLTVKIVVFVMIAWLLYRFFRRPFLDVFLEIKKGWWGLMLMPCSLDFAFAMIIMIPGPLYTNPHLQPQALMMCVAVVCLYIGFYYIFMQMRDQYRYHENYRILDAQIKALEQQVGAMSLINGQMSMFRHDMRHFMQMQSACIRDRDWTATEQILGTLSEKFHYIMESEVSKVYTGQTLIDTVLSLHERSAVQDGIGYTINMEGPSGTFIDTAEFAVVLSNALENAVNACKKIKKGQTRSIRVTGRNIKDQYFIEISNTYSEQVKFDGENHPVSRERDHGFGTRSIADFAKRNNARLEYRIEHGWFLLRMIISLNQEGKPAK